VGKIAVSVKILPATDGTRILPSLRRLISRCLILLCLAALPSTSRAWDTGFWTWHRADPLGDAEREELTAYGAHTLYWHVGEIENRDGEWRWKVPPVIPRPSTKELHVVDVIRLSSFVQDPYNSAAVDALSKKIHAIAPDEVQLDTDCPDRLLTQFAAALKQIHAQVPHLSVTALEGWCHHPAWEQLQAAVDEIVPMFYDVQIDPPVPGVAGPLPLVDAAKVRRELAEWSGCKAQWRAGLPLFSRLTVYDQTTGLSRGHIRDWSWDDLCFNKSLETVAATTLGVTLLRASETTTVGNIPVKKGDHVGVRWPDRDALAAALDTAKNSGAAGVVFFRLPDSTDPSGWSLKQLAHLDTVPRLILRKQPASPQLELVNDAPADLEPRLSGKDAHDRGYAVELEADALVFREAVEGDFWRVTGHAGSGPDSRVVAIPLATRLTFWFSHLRAGQSLSTGLIQLAPGVDFSQIRYHIVNIPGDSKWQNIQD